MVEAQHLHLSGNEGLESGRGLWLTWPTNVILYGSRDDHHYCVDLIGVSPPRRSWRDTASAFAIVDMEKRDKRAQTYQVNASISFPSVFRPFSLFAPLHRSFSTACDGGTVFMSILLSGRSMRGSTSPFFYPWVG